MLQWVPRLALIIGIVVVFAALVAVLEPSVLADITPDGFTWDPLGFTWDVL